MNPDDALWLLSELVIDPVDTSRCIAIGIAVDCVRMRLSEEDLNTERQQIENARITEYNRLIKDRLAQATLIKNLGLDGAKARMRELRLHDTSLKDKSFSIMYRFKCLIERVFEYFRFKAMKMEPFQIELFRGVVLGVTMKQFGDSLYKYKHALLDHLYLAPLGSENYNYVNPALGHAFQVDKKFTHYANPYTLCRIPRQCGKTMMMRLLLAAVLLHLDINVMVQAQNKHMCTTFRVGVEDIMLEIQQMPSFKVVEKPVRICGNPENRTYKFLLGYKGSSFVHFLSSSNDVSKCLHLTVVILHDVSVSILFYPFCTGSCMILVTSMTPRIVSHPSCVYIVCPYIPTC